MNRLDITLAADPSLGAGVTILSSERLGGWSGEDFALAIELARAPATFRSGLGDGLLHLVVAEEPNQDAVVVLPLDIDGKALTLGVGRDALDALAGLLSDEVSTDAGANLSLDAIEALCVATLSPLMRIDVGRASWGQSANGVAALKVGNVQISLHGEREAVLALQAIMVAVGAAQPSPFALLGQPLAQRMAVGTEQVLALADLSEADHGALEPGCGILLDTLWPIGRQVAGQRFVKSGLEWQLDAGLQASCLHVRSSAQVQMLDELSLNASLPDPSGSNLELVDGERVIARGRLTSVEISGRARMVFQVDQLV